MLPSGLITIPVAAPISGTGVSTMPQSCQGFSQIAGFKAAVYLSHAAVALRDPRSCDRLIHRQPKINQIDGNAQHSSDDRRAARRAKSQHRTIWGKGDRGGDAAAGMFTRFR